MCFSFFYLHLFPSVLVACLLPFSLVLEKGMLSPLTARSQLRCQSSDCVTQQVFSFSSSKFSFSSFFFIEDYYSYSASLLTCIKIIFLLFLLIKATYFPHLPPLCFSHFPNGVSRS